MIKPLPQPRSGRDRVPLMRLWLQSRTVRATLVVATAISVAAHAGSIAWWVIATLPQADVAKGSIANRVFYIPPPDRAPPGGGTRERVTYLKLSTQGAGRGEGPRAAGEARPVTGDQTLGRDTVGKDSLTTHATPASATADSVYSIVEVDTAAVRSVFSAAPAYPVKLLEEHVQGFVNARYVVDTVGLADTTTFVVLQATNAEFVAAVREALPHMQFQPAKIGQSKVRQLVQQQFSFRITDTATVSGKATKP